MKKKYLLSLFWLISSFTLLAQNTVNGIVTAQENNETLPGVTIREKGTAKGTITNADGEYSIEVSGDAVLIFSYVGYSSQEIPVNGRSMINVSLFSDVRQLSEVVVVGYGTMRREDISGAVSSVRTDELPTVANTSINHMLQGRAPGLNITQRSAQPGGGLNINIRGSISPQGSNAPLYVIDGVPLFNNSQAEPGLSGGQLGFGGGVDRNPLNTINPADIESIDILKDASATAIYGSSAANGVVLITTKRGKEGPMRVEYQGSYTVQTPTEYIELFGPKEFMQQHNRLAHDRYLFQKKLAPYGNTDPSTIADPFNPTFSTYDIQNIAGRGTDWLDLLMRNGEIHEHNISISGGTENTKVYTAFNLFDNQAILENSGFRRYTGRLNVDQLIGDRVKIGVNMTASQINSTNVSTGANSGGVEKYNMLQAAYSFSPTLDIFTPEGRYTRSFDPLITNPAGFLIMDDDLTTSRFFVAPNVEFKILDNLKLNVTGGVDRQNAQRGFYIPRAVENTQYPAGAAQKSVNNIANYSSEAYLTYDRTSGDISINAVAGGGLYKTATNFFNVDAVDFFTDVLKDNNLAAATAKELSAFGSNKTERNRQSLFSRINLGYKDKYLLSLTGRYDGDSEFAANKKFGFFPGASIAWKINNEPFLDNISFLSGLKLRAGIGQAGNPVNAGSAIALMGLNTAGGLQDQYLYPVGGIIHNGVALLQLANPDLSWETNETINLGLDFELWTGRLSGSVEVYQRTARDLLDFDQLPLSNEIVRIRQNIGSTRSQGIEFNFTSVNLDGPVTWSTTITGTTYKSFWVERNQAIEQPEWVKNDDPYTATYGWRTDGIIQSREEIPSYMPNANPGNIRYVDVNKDGTLDAKDVVLLGQSTPKWNLGLANTLKYKNFDLNFFFNAYLGNLRSINSIGRGYNVNSPGDRLALNNMQNVPVEVRRVWTADNPDGDLPGVASDAYAGFNPSGNHNFSLQKADFARLRNVTLGYTFSNDLIGKTFIRNARIFVDAQNLATFTNFDGFDPELNETNPFPQAISTTVGVNLGF